MAQSRQNDMESQMREEVGNFYLGGLGQHAGKTYICTGGDSKNGEFIRLVPPDNSLTPFLIPWEELETVSVGEQYMKMAVRELFLFSGLGGNLR
jgi:hypothetical protein